MKLTVGAFSLLFAAGAAMAGTDFPYADSLTQRYSLTGPTTISSFETETPVPPVVEGGGMQSSEHVAVITADVANFTAADPDDWTECTTSLTGLQASLSMKYDENDNLCWMGYTASGWVPLTNVTPTEGAWSVKIEIDYSVTPKVVRYSVKALGSTGDYTTLTNKSATWLPLAGTDSVVNDIGLLGYGTVNSVSGDCAARPFNGKVTTMTENFNMQYENLKVHVVAEDAWGDTAKVTLKKNGVAVEGAVAFGSVNANGTCDFEADFSGKTEVGEDYTFDVEFLKGDEKTGTKIGQADTSGKTVKLYSEIEWFGFKNGAFEKATSEGIALNANGFASADDEIIGDVDPVNSSDDDAQTTVETEVIVAGVSPINELPTEVGQQFAVSLATDNGIRKWAYRVGENSWTESSATLDTTNGTYYVKVTFDYRDGNKTGTCWVKPEGGDYVALVTGFTLGTATKLAGTSVLGGDVGYMNASFKTVSPAPVVPKDGKIEMNGSNVKVDLAQATAGTYTFDKTHGGHLSWKDADGKYAKVDENDKFVIADDTGKKNGMDSYESYLLGLDPEDETSKPIVKQVQNDDASKITFELPGLSPKPESETGVAVSYELLELEKPKATTADKTTSFTDTVTVDLPASGAKYYKVNIKTTK